MQPLRLDVGLVWVYPWSDSHRNALWFRQGRIRDLPVTSDQLYTRLHVGSKSAYDNIGRQQPCVPSGLAKKIFAV